ncbi:Protein winged eye [Frankliniella fusca]|uniref:Protein winged eye n=1 Tax=Frankliniella fusca TaxID=407009 RepID=A0AAE1I2A9_9NEOP|nr:Protein winged eye [Frankliniella fusca]
MHSTSDTSWYAEFYGEIRLVKLKRGLVCSSNQKPQRPTTTYSASLHQPNSSMTPLVCVGERGDGAYSMAKTRLLGNTVILVILNSVGLRSKVEACNETYYCKIFIT